MESGRMFCGARNVSAVVVPPRGTDWLGVCPGATYLRRNRSVGVLPLGIRSEPAMVTEPPLGVVPGSMLVTIGASSQRSATFPAPVKHMVVHWVATSVVKLDNVSMKSVAAMLQVVAWSHLM